jgi:hypothetical protein
MPTTQGCRPVCVVGEEEVLDRMRLPSAPAAKMWLDPGIHPRLVPATTSVPNLLVEHVS